MAGGREGMKKMELLAGTGLQLSDQLAIESVVGGRRSESAKQDQVKGERIVVYVEVVPLKPKHAYALKHALRLFEAERGDSLTLLHVLSLFKKNPSVGRGAVPLGPGVREALEACLLEHEQRAMSSLEELKKVLCDTQNIHAEISIVPCGAADVKTTLLNTLCQMKATKVIMDMTIQKWPISTKSAIVDSFCKEEVPCDVAVIAKDRVVATYIPDLAGGSKGCPTDLLGDTCTGSALSCLFNPSADGSVSDDDDSGTVRSHALSHCAPPSVARHYAPASTKQILVQHRQEEQLPPEPPTENILPAVDGNQKPTAVESSGDTFNQLLTNFLEKLPWSKLATQSEQRIEGKGTGGSNSTRAWLLSSTTATSCPSTTLQTFSEAPDMCRSELNTLSSEPATSTVSLSVEGLDPHLCPSSVAESPLPAGEKLPALLTPVLDARDVTVRESSGLETSSAPPGEEGPQEEYNRGEEYECLADGNDQEQRAPFRESIRGPDFRCDGGEIQVTGIRVIPEDVPQEMNEPEKDALDGQVVTINAPGAVQFPSVVQIDFPNVGHSGEEKAAEVVPHTHGLTVLECIAEDEDVLPSAEVLNAALPSSLSSVSSSSLSSSQASQTSLSSSSSSSTSSSSSSPSSLLSPPLLPSSFISVDSRFHHRMSPSADQEDDREGKVSALGGTSFGRSWSSKTMGYLQLALLEEMQPLELKNRKLTEELSRLHMELQQVADKEEKYQRRIDELEAALRDLKLRFKDKERHCEMLLKMLKDVEGHKQDAEARATHEEERRMNLERGLEKAQKSLEDVVKTVGEFRRKEEVLRRDLDQARKFIEEEKRRVAEIDGYRNDEATRRAILEIQLQNLQDEVNEKAAALECAPRPLCEFSYEELQQATDDFSDSRKLGESRFGTTYVGEMQIGRVGVKVLRSGWEQDLSFEELRKEVEMLSCIHHPNLVMLLGACVERRCLVYEFMDNNSLQTHLSGRSNTDPLPWHVRFRIAAEVARTLHFLHACLHEPVVHRDLKPANIFLNKNYVSKIGNLGINRLIPQAVAESYAMHNTMQPQPVLLRTYAYVDPEYFVTGTLVPQSDVYALGIIILQLLTGKNSPEVSGAMQLAIADSQLESILDQTAGRWNLDQARKVALLALKCAEVRRRNRPDLQTQILPVLGMVAKLAAEEAAVEMSARQVGIPAEAVASMFMCPITQDIMENPVVAADGHTYERSAIESWLQTHQTSPMTNLVMPHKNLIPNHSLRSSIAEWRHLWRANSQHD